MYTWSLFFVNLNERVSFLYRNVCVSIYRKVGTDRTIMHNEQRTLTLFRHKLSEISLCSVAKCTR